MKEHYLSLLSTGMLFEFYPNLTGEWEKDKKEWKKEYGKLKRKINPSNERKGEIR